MVRSSENPRAFPRKRGGRRRATERPAVRGGRHPKGRNEVKESEAKPETCGPPPRAYKGAPPTPREGKANKQRHREAMTAGARVSGRCARDRSRMAGICEAEPGSREPGARHRRAGAHSGYSTVRVRLVLTVTLLFGPAIRGYPTTARSSLHSRLALSLRERNGSSMNRALV